VRTHCARVSSLHALLLLNLLLPLHGRLLLLLLEEGGLLHLLDPALRSGQLLLELTLALGVDLLAVRDLNTVHMGIARCRMKNELK